MTRKVSLALYFLVALTVTLISFSAVAQSGNRGKRSQKEFVDTHVELRHKCGYKAYVVCISNAQHSLRKHGEMSRWEKDRQRCDSQIHSVIGIVRTWEQACEGNRASLLCHNPPTNKAEPASKSEFWGCMNTVHNVYHGRIARMDAEFAERRRIAAITAERKRRQDAVTQLAVLGPDDVKKPANFKPKAEPKVHLSDAEADRAMTAVNAYAVATNSALSALPPPPATSVPTAAKPPKAYDFQQERYNQWRTAHPKAVAKANKPAKKATTPEGYSKVRINCIPEHVSVRKIADNGDVELFIGKGADIYQLHRCFPGHNFDPQAVADGNSAASIILYYLKYSDKPLAQNELVFDKKRWNIKRQDWKTPGKEFFADFFRENSGKEFGFALQGGQKLALSAKAEPPTPSNAEPAVEPNAPAKHGKYKQVQPEEKQLRLANAGYVNQPASDIEPAVAGSSAQLVSSSKEQLSKASSQNSSNYPDAMLSIPPTGQVILIRAGPRDARAMYIQEKRYRRGGGADLNLSNNLVRYQAQERLPFCEHYGQYAFG